MFGCIEWSERVPNPYLLPQWIVVGILVLTFALWATVKPPAVTAIRVTAAACAVITLFVVLASTFGMYRTVEPESRLALQASLLLTSCLVAELIGGWRRERIPRAIARWFR